MFGVLYMGSIKFCFVLFCFGLLFLEFFDPFFSFIWGYYTYVLWQAHYMLGLALLQKKEYTDGVKELQRVWILAYTKLFPVKFINGHDCLSRNIET